MELLSVRASLRFALVSAWIVGGVASCQYDYEALMGAADGGSHANPGTAGAPGIAGSTGRGGSGSGGSESPSGTGGAGSVGTAGTTGEGGGTGGGSAGREGGAGAGGGRGGVGGTGGGAGGTVGSGGRGGASGAGHGGSAGRAEGGASGVAGAAGRGGTSGTGAAGATGSGGAAGGTAGNAGAGGRPDADLVVWYKFDDGSGSIAADSSTAPGAPRNGMLATAGTGGAVAFSTNHQVGTHAVNLTANGMTGGGYVVVPSLHDVAPAALTITAWVNVTTAQPWQRVFDIGNTSTSNLGLTTYNGAGQVRFIIRTGGVEQPINSTVTLSVSKWHHLAVVLPAGSPYTGLLYVDGVLAATNPTMTFHAADLGATANNYLGRSQFVADPYFAGLIDDFRVYRRALSPEQITAVFNAR
jgi:hypothetical protein